MSTRNSEFSVEHLWCGSRSHFEHLSLWACSADSKEKKQSPSSLDVASLHILSKEVKAQRQEYPEEWKGLNLSASRVCYAEGRGKEILVRYLIWGWEGLLWGLKKVKRFNLPPGCFFFSHLLSNAFLKMFTFWATVFSARRCKSDCDFRSTNVNQWDQRRW